MRTCVRILLLFLLILFRFFNFKFKIAEKFCETYFDEKKVNNIFYFCLFVTDIFYLYISYENLDFYD